MIRTPAASLILAGTILSLLAGAAGAVVVGPFVRQAFGAPYGYASDYTSLQAGIEALLVQTGTVLVSFFVGGWAFSKRVRDSSWKTALWAANPMTVGVAFFVLMICLDGAKALDGDEPTLEYFGPTMWLTQLCLAAPLYASVLSLGARLRRRHSEAA